METGFKKTDCELHREEAKKCVEQIAVEAMTPDQWLQLAHVHAELATAAALDEAVCQFVKISCILLEKMQTE